MEPELRERGAAGPGLVELAGLAWVRTQLTLRLRATASGAPAPATLVLARGRARAATMPATGGQVEGDVVVVRFNVMSGPGRTPLGSGTWALAALDPPGRPRPLPLVAPPDVPREAELAVATPGGRYAARAALRPMGGAVGLEVRIAASRRRRLRRELRSALKRAVLRVLVGAAHARPARRRRRVLFVSSRPGLTGNVRIVYERMRQRGLDREVGLEVLTTGDRARSGRPGRLGRSRGLRRLGQRLRRLWRIAGADVILVENSRTPVLYQFDFPPSVRFIQLWHAAGAFKMFKRSRIGKRGGPDPWGRAHRNYTHAIVSSAHERPFYAEAFGIPEASVVATGIPRQDVFFDARRRAAGLRAARAAYPASDGRFTILFAPTYRGSALRARYDLDRIDCRALHSLCVEKDAVCIVRMHPAVEQPLGIPDALGDRLLGRPAAPIDVRDLMFAVDLLVTDYSSIMFDFALLRRPMLFYAYDLEAYVGSRDFYEPYERLVPGRIVRSFEELLEAIRRDDYEAHKVDAFVAQRLAQADGRATDRVIDELILPPADR